MKVTYTNTKMNEQTLLEDSYYITQAQERDLEDFLEFANTSLNLKGVKEEVLKSFHETCQLALEDSNTD